MRVFSDLNLNGQVPTRAQAGRGSWGPKGVPSTRWDVYHHFAYADLAVKHPLVWDFYWDAFVTLGVVQTLDDNFAPKRQLHELLTDAVWMVDLQRKGTEGRAQRIRERFKFLRPGCVVFDDFDHWRWACYQYRWAAVLRLVCQNWCAGPEAA